MFLEYCVIDDIGKTRLKEFRNGDVAVIGFQTVKTLKQNPDTFFRIYSLNILPVKRWGHLSKAPPIYLPLHE